MTELKDHPKLGCVSQACDVELRKYDSQIIRHANDFGAVRVIA